MLLAAALSVLLAAALTTALVVGLRVLQEATTRGERVGTYGVGVARLERDLRNALPFRPVPYVGTHNAVRLVVPSVPGSDDGRAWGGVEVVRYQYDTKARALTRKSWRFPLEEPADDQAEYVISSVDDFHLAYYDPAPGTKGLARWRESWNSSTNLPAAVSVKLKVRGLRGAQEVAWVTARPVR